MFDFVRKHNRWMQFGLLVLVVPAFVAISFYGYSQNSTGPEVAKVGNTAITQMQWDQEVQRQGQVLRQRDPSFDASLLDAPEQKYRVLEELLRQTVLQTATQKMHLRASDAQVAQALAQDPNIASLRGSDGTMDMKQYQALLAANGLTVAQYEAKVRQELSERQLQEDVYGTTVTVQNLRQVLGQALLQSRQVQLARFASADYLAQAKPTPEQEQGYYQQHRDMFKVPAQIDMQYVVLSPADVAAKLTFSDEQLRQYYAQNQARFAGQEERRASHILFAKKDQAEAALAQLKAKPERFAELAKKDSQDPGSAAQGGDLGFLTKGATANPAFDDAVFALAKEQLSAVVQSPAGYHIIKVTDIKGQAKPFEAVKAEVLEAVKAEQGAKKYAELSENFRNAVEDMDDLNQVAKQLGLQVHTVTGLQQGSMAAKADPIVGNAKLQKAIFTADALAGKHNTPALEVGNSVLVSAHVTRHLPASVQPFAQVQAQVQALVTAERAQALALQTGQAKLAEWKKAPATAKLDAALSVSRQHTQNLPAPVVEAILKANSSQLPAWVGVEMPQHGGYVVAKIEKVQAPTDDSPEAQAARQQIEQLIQPTLSQAETQAFLALLRAQYKAKILVPKPAVAAPAAAASAAKGEDA
ncbi:MAG: SurA N-terminal domain-containing protein [Brachymonas sp.]